MPLNYLIVLAPPYLGRDIAAELDALGVLGADPNKKTIRVLTPGGRPSEFKALLDLYNLADPLNNETKVLFLGDFKAQGNVASIKSMMQTLTQLVIGKVKPVVNPNAPIRDVVLGDDVKDILWSGTTYISDSTPELVIAMQGVIGAGPIVLRERRFSATTQLDAEARWLVTIDHLKPNPSNLNANADFLLGAAIAIPENVTILQRGLPPLELKTPTTLSEAQSLDSVKLAIQSFVDVNKSALPTYSLERQKLLGLEQAMLKLAGTTTLTPEARSERVAVALRRSIAGGLDAFLAFAKSVQKEQLASYLNQLAPGDMHLPLAAAAATGNVALVNALLDAGAELVPPQDAPMSALAVAASLGHEKVFELLMERALNSGKASELMKMHDHQGLTVLMHAAMGSSHKIIREILNANPNAWGTIDEVAKGSFPLFEAASNGSELMVLALLDGGATRGLVTPGRGYTALMGAAMNGNVEVIPLLQAGTLDARDDHGDTALWHAAANGHDAAVGALLGAGADPASTDRYGGTPLQAAAGRGYLSVVRTLLDANVPIGEGALFEAVSAGHAEIVQALIDRGAPVGSNFSEPLLIAAISSGNKRVFDILLGAKGIDLNARDKKGETALDFALRLSLRAGGPIDERVATLLRAGALHGLSKDPEFRAPRPDPQKVLVAPGNAFLSDTTWVKAGVVFEGSATIQSNAQIRKNVKLGDGVEIGARTIIGTSTVVGKNTFVGGGIRIKRDRTIDADLWIDNTGIYTRNPDGTKGPLKDAPETEKYNHWVGTKKVLKASGDPADLPGSHLRDQPPPDGSAGAFASGEVVPGERIDHDPEVHNKGAQGEALWKGALSEVTTDPLLGPEGARPALSAAEYRAHIERNLGFALERVFAAEQLDFVARAALVAEAQSVFMKYILPVVDKALVELAPAGGAISLDALSAKLGERSAAEHLADSIEAADPKNGVLRQQALRQAAILLTQLNGDLRNQVAAYNVLLPDWPQIYERLGGGDRAQTRIGFDQLWLRKVASASPLSLNRYDLEIQVMGSSDKVTIAGWERAGGFAPHDPNANHIELIKAADGKTLADTKVAQLVQAMAGMAPPTGATSWSQLAPSQQAQLQALGAWS